MRRIIVEEWMSLDGNLADRDGSLAFFEKIGSEDNKYANEDQLKFLESVDTILLGRKTYELFLDFWPTADPQKEIVTDYINLTKKQVITNTLQEAPWGKWEPAEIISGDAIEAIKKLKAQQGKDIVVWGSISLVQSLIDAKLVDELHIQLCPALTGGGRTMFSDKFNPANLTLLNSKTYETGVVLLIYVFKD